MKRQFGLTVITIFLLAILVTSAYVPRVVAQDDLPNCGTEPVTLRGYFETGFDLPFRLAEEFERQFPNVSWDISRTSLRTSSTPRHAC